MPDRIFIERLCIPMVIGVEPKERAKPQDICFDIEFPVSVEQAAKTDQLTDTIDYKSLCERISEFVNQSQYQLIETLAKAIADWLIREFSLDWVKLALTKKPFDMPDVKGVRISIERP